MKQDAYKTLQLRWSNNVIQGCSNTKKKKISLCLFSNICKTYHYLNSETIKNYYWKPINICIRVNFCLFWTCKLIIVNFSNWCMHNYIVQFYPTIRIKLIYTSHLCITKYMYFGPIWRYSIWSISTIAFLIHIKEVMSQSGISWRFSDPSARFYPSPRSFGDRTTQTPSFTLARQLSQWSYLNLFANISSRSSELGWPDNVTLFSHWARTFISWPERDGRSSVCIYIHILLRTSQLHKIVMEAFK